MARYFKIFFLILYACYAANIQAQHMAAWTDIQGRFWVFDNGHIEQLEHLRVDKFKVGGNCIIYENARQDLIYYQAPKKKTLLSSPAIDKFFPFRTFVLSRLNNVLSVVDGDYIKTISLEENTIFQAGDSIVAFIDFDDYLKVYQGQHIFDIDNSAVREFAVSDKSLAYINGGDVLRFWHGGEDEEVSGYFPKNFMVGNSYVAYLTHFDEWAVFYAGENQILSKYPPLSFKHGDDIVAYVDERNNFYVWQNGTAKMLLENPPTYYEITDNTLVYLNELNQLWSYYNGNTQVLDASPVFVEQPNKLQLSQGMAAWQDRYGYLKIFYKGNITEVGDRIAQNFTLFGHTLLYDVNNKDYRIFFNGKEIMP